MHWVACGTRVAERPLLSFLFLSPAPLGGAHLTVNYFWLNMISLCWASHCAANPDAGGPAPLHPVCVLLQPCLHSCTLCPLSLATTDSAALGRFSVAEDSSHGVAVAAYTDQMSFDNFMLLPQAAKLGVLVLVGAVIMSDDTTATCTPSASHARSADEELVAKHYSQALLSSDSARSSMALPDLQPMPTRV